MFFYPEFLKIPEQRTRQISVWKNSTCLGKLRCMFLILKEDLKKKYTEKLKTIMMGKVDYMKRQLKKVHVSEVRIYWRSRKEKRKKRLYGPFFLSKLQKDVHSIMNPQFRRFEVSLSYRGKRKGWSGHLTSVRSPAELQTARGCSLVRGFVLRCRSCSPLSTFYHPDVVTALWGKKGDHQRENKQHLHLDVAGEPSHPEGKKLFMPLPAATSGPAMGEEVRAWVLGWYRASWHDLSISLTKPHKCHKK